MRAVIQRVNSASVYINEQEYSSISNGLLVLLGIESADNDDDIHWLCKKIVHLRIFDDEKGVMNKSLLDVNGEIMLVSQFTLHASTKKGNRPSYVKAAPPDIAIPLYEKVKIRFTESGIKSLKTGEFGAHMKINLCNDGPVTIIIDTKNKS